jgi:quercetin dioxygenase-like cupin family protein
MTSLRRGIALGVLGLAGLCTVAVAGEPKFKGTVLDQVTLGRLNGDYVMKVTMLDMEAGAQVPEHTHKGPGLRYVLEGAITIAWKGGKTETFKAGSTYYEAAGSNHPIGQMSARNAADGRTRVLIFELDPKE